MKKVLLPRALILLGGLDAESKTTYKEKMRIPHPLGQMLSA